MLPKSIGGLQSWCMPTNYMPPPALSVSANQELDLYVAYRTIEANKNITSNQLKFLMSKNAIFTQSRTGELVRKLIELECIGTFIRLNSRDNLHLNVKAEQSLEFEVWLTRMADLNPSLYIPIYVRKRVYYEIV